MKVTVVYTLGKIMGRYYKVENSKADTLFGRRVRRTNFILDVMDDKKSWELKAKWGTKN